MHRSGISVSQELRQVFDECDQGSCGYLLIQIENEDFRLIARVESAGSLEANFASVASHLQPKQPVYALIKQADHQWITVFYVPEGSQVKHKMLYASSRSGLKEGLGSQRFASDFFISDKAECKLTEYEKSTKQEDNHQLLTFEERMKKEAVQSSVASADNVRLTAMGDIPINVSEDAATALKQYAAKSLSLVLLTLDSKTEVLSAAYTEAKTKIEDVATRLETQFAKVPVYVLCNFAHEHENKQSNANIFVYYCPDLAQPRQKMFYSSAKSMVAKVITNLGIEINKNLEMSEHKDMSQRALIDELYPKKVDSKSFAKPKRQGKGVARLAPKFQTPE